MHVLEMYLLMNLFTFIFICVLTVDRVCDFSAGVVWNCGVSLSERVLSVFGV